MSFLFLIHLCEHPILMTDTYKHKGRRKKLVDALIQKGIEDPYVLAAVGKIPRHLFMESYLDEYAYVDKAFPIAAGQTISQPYTVAFQTQLLNLKKGERILEIGTGSGYQTAVLLECYAKVFTIERQRKLYASTKDLLEGMGYKAYFQFGDGYAGLPTFGPFDKILVTAGAEEMPNELLKQLKVGGWMVIPFGGSKSQRMLRIKRLSEREFEQEDFGNFAFVPMLKGTNN